MHVRKGGSGGLPPDTKNFFLKEFGGSGGLPPDKIAPRKKGLRIGPVFPYGTPPPIAINFIFTGGSTRNANLGVN